MSSAKYVAGDDETTLAKLQRKTQSLTRQSVGIHGSAKVETLAAAAYYELHYPINLLFLRL